MVRSGRKDGVGTGGVGLLYIYQMEVLKGYEDSKSSLNLQFVHDATSA